MEFTLPNELVDALAKEINDSLAAVELAVAGLTQLAREVLARPAPPENPDPMLLCGGAC